jgi:hypothetical protein
VLVPPKPARVRSAVDWISASTRPRAAVRPDLFMILTLAGVIRSYPQVLPGGVRSRKSRFTSDVTAASLGVLTGTHRVADRRRATVDHFVPKDHRCRNLGRGEKDLDQLVLPTDIQDVSVVPRQCGNTTGAETSLTRPGDPSAKPYRTRFRRDRPGRSNQRRTEPQ